MRIVCIGDSHYSGMRWRGDYLKRINQKFYQKLFAAVFAQEADLYLSLGDLTHFGSQAEFRGIYSIIEGAKSSGQVFYQLVGNHDLYRFSKWAYQRLTGMNLYWADDRPDVKLIFLDTSRQHHPGKRSGRMDIAQVRFLDRELQTAEDKLCLVFGHHPISRIEVTDESGKLIPGFSLMDVLRQKKGSGIYVNGHLHKDCYHVENNWGFLQFNDILDEPTIRILDIDRGRLSLDTVTCTDEEYLGYSQQIAGSILTFRRTRNDEAFAPIRGLDMSYSRDQVSINEISQTDSPFYSKKAKVGLKVRLAGVLWGLH